MKIAVVRVLLLLTLTSCATAPATPVATKPEWSAVPAGILEFLCRRLQGDAIGIGGAPVLVVRHTQPLVNFNSLESLQNAHFKQGRAAKLAEAISASDRTLPVDVRGGSCAWQAVDVVDPMRHADMMAVELSSPFANPFAPREAGMFARVSLGGRDASWYWIPLERRADTWVPGQVLPLDLHDR